jgi:hypothetical protein
MFSVKFLRTGSGAKNFIKFKIFHHPNSKWGAQNVAPKQIDFPGKHWPPNNNKKTK